MSLEKAVFKVVIPYDCFRLLMIEQLGVRIEFGADTFG